MNKRTEEKRVEEEGYNRKRRGGEDEDDLNRKHRKRKLKPRFLNSDPREALVNTGTKLTKMKIWSKLELMTREVSKVQRKVKEENDKACLELIRDLEKKNDDVTLKSG